MGYSDQQVDSTHVRKRFRLFLFRYLFLCLFVQLLFPHLPLLRECERDRAIVIDGRFLREAGSILAGEIDITGLIRVIKSRR